MATQAAIVSNVPVSSGFQAAVEAFDTACRTPGADPAAQKVAITKVAKLAEAQTKGSETFDGPSGRYILIGMGNLAACALNASYEPKSLPLDLTKWIESRYGAKPKLRASKVMKSFAWIAENRNFQLILVDDQKSHVFFLQVMDKR